MNRWNFFFLFLITYFPYFFSSSPLKLKRLSNLFSLSVCMLLKHKSLKIFRSGKIYNLILIQYGKYFTVLREKKFIKFPFKALVVSLTCSRTTMLSDSFLQRTKKILHTYFCRKNFLPSFLSHKFFR